MNIVGEWNMWCNPKLLLINCRCFLWNKAMMKWINPTFALLHFLTASDPFFFMRTRPLWILQPEFMLLTIFVCLSYMYMYSLFLDYICRRYDCTPPTISASSLEPSHRSSTHGAWSCLWHNSTTSRASSALRHSTFWMRHARTMLISTVWYRWSLPCSTWGTRGHFYLQGVYLWLWEERLTHKLVCGTKVREHFVGWEPEGH